MDFNWDVLGHIAFVFLLLGKFLVIHKYRWGFLSWAVGAGMWAYIGYNIGMGSLVVWNGIYIAMYLYGFYYWGKPNHKVEEIQ